MVRGIKWIWVKGHGRSEFFLRYLKFSSHKLLLLNWRVQYDLTFYLSLSWFPSLCLLSKYSLFCPQFLLYWQWNHLLLQPSLLLLEVVRFSILLTINLKALLAQLQMHGLKATNCWTKSKAHFLQLHQSLSQPLFPIFLLSNHSLVPKKTLVTIFTGLVHQSYMER